MYMQLSHTCDKTHALTRGDALSNISGQVILDTAPCFNASVI